MYRHSSQSLNRMNKPTATPSEIARSVFVVPRDFAAAAKPLADLSAAAPPPLQSITSSFLDSLHGVVRTLSIPFQYTYSQVRELHWQRILMAERIRARGIDNEAEREPNASRPHWLSREKGLTNTCRAMAASGLLMKWSIVCSG
jgi:hypothetical protein